MSDTSDTSSTSELITRFQPVLDRIGGTTRQHETDRTLPVAEVRDLADAGFGALRLPESEGGAGVTLQEFFALLVALGEADSNQPQIWRNHIAFVEDRLQPEPDAQNRRWRKELAAGAVFGGAWSERTNRFTDSGTTLSGDRLTGVKYYSTGSIFADWISVYAKQDGLDVIVIAAADAPGVELSDDWNGIGQRVTGSGTTVFTDVPVAAEAVYPFGARAPYQEAVYQLVHLATLAGIGRAARRDVVEALGRRTRAYPQGLGDVPRQDAQLLAVVGRVAALASAAEASVDRAARRLDVAAAAAAVAGAPEAEVTPLVDAATVAVYEAQLTVVEDVLAATTLLFDALGSSAVERDAQLDRHWRNARTVSSHNPRVYKERLVGDWYLNGVAPAILPAPNEGTGGS
jgi:alkylation response protein AidB-like acyl-CoA dehydrogenase